MSARQQLRVQGKEIGISNLEKVFYPKTGFTKADVIDYYIKIAPVLLPHLKGRAVTLKRYPDGVTGEFFYEKQCPSHAPSWIKTTPVKKSDGSLIHYCVLGDLPSLVWAAGIANLELHPFLHRSKAITRPASLVFDLDPGPPAGIIQCCRVGLWICDLLGALGLECMAKTSGSKGLQLCLPLNTAVHYDRSKAFAHAVARTLEARFPEAVVSDMKKSLRKGKVLIDWSQNDDTKTTVGVYSLRAKDTPTVSTPVTWDEVEHALKKRKAALLSFDFKQVLKRVDRLGDLFAPTLELKQKLPSISSLDEQ